MERIAGEVLTVNKMGVEICLVIGGGNMCRGLSGVAAGLDRASADHMGMLATVINALGMQSVLEGAGVETRVLSAIPMATVCEPYIRRRAMRHMEKERVVIFAAGTGNPYFTTDTAAALRAAEMKCDALFKGTQVDGVYAEDPKKNPDAERYDKLGYLEVLAKDLKVMDATAFALCRSNNMPIRVVNLNTKGNLQRVAEGDSVGTLVVKSGGQDA